MIFMVVYDGLVCEEEPDKYIIVDIRNPCLDPDFDFLSLSTTRYIICGCWTITHEVLDYTQITHQLFMYEDTIVDLYPIS